MTLANFYYPVRSAVAEVAADWVQGELKNDPLFYPNEANQNRPPFPLVYVDAAELRWLKERVLTGMMNVRGYDAPLHPIKVPGREEFVSQPMVGGEKIPIDEVEITRREGYARGGTVDLRDMIRQHGLKLTKRATTLMRYVWYSLLCATPSNSVSTVSIQLPNGGVGYTEKYSFKYYTAAVAWATYATARPLYCFQSLKTTYGKGSGVSFGRKAMAIMNPNTFLSMMLNTNANDLFGIRANFGATIQLDRGRILASMDSQDLPRPTVLEDGYYDDTGTFNYYVPDNKVLVVGYREIMAETESNLPVDLQDGTGYTVLTRNANSGTLDDLSQPIRVYREQNMMEGTGKGFIVDYIDHLRQDGHEIRKVDVVSYLNWMPVVFHQNDIAVMTV
jgi:hypothetical protein